MPQNQKNEVQELKEKLKLLSKDNVQYSDHFLIRMAQRDGNLAEVITLLLNPEKLVYFYKEKSNQGEIVYNLHFKISNTKTLKLPVIIDRYGHKNLYIITYIMIYEPWKKAIKKWIY
ncbi:MAG: hypothetical protein AMQ74_01039 [Candidatus Methanofastidiosum methylothiophilum]|jgi:uncharacterized protein YvpB|uniref:Uncharacterized protein n=1 Tax=Candidatus Methanofastidiosum methylothiophilum TaxID=1705564 RepID=A0A150J3G2_9EURY|nr:MAG: hypothetical protein AMQ74_01039 [Candidatus Methanofastidiosum methylthiophilus]NMC76307.1 hypothetical protein [Candidatus Methanofastidiosa archaeon]